MHCVCKRFNYFLHSVLGAVTVLRQKVAVAHNISFRLLYNSTVLSSSQNSVQKNTYQVSAYSSKYGKISTVLMKYGFSEEQMRRVIHFQPEILDFDEKDITSNIINWFSFKMNERDLFRTLASYPELLVLNPEYVNNRVKELLTLFTHKDILKLLKTYPGVFLEDWDIIMQKMEYLLHYIRAEQKTIVKYGALQYSLDHIKKRHVLLLFMGKFKTPTAKKKQNNPSIDVIFGKKSAFLNLTGLSEEEYVAFNEVFPEMEFENLYGLESDDESDTSDNESDESSDEH